MNKGLSLIVPVSGQVAGIEEAEAVARVMESGQYASNKIADEFEHKFAAYVGKRYGLFVNSGSSANFLAVKTVMELGHKQFVTPACAFPTTVNPIVEHGGKLHFVDVDIDTLLPDNANYGAMTLGNYYPYSMIQDSCDAMHPGLYTGLAQTFSFFPAHHMTTGEGGMITTDNADFFRIARSLRDWGRDCYCMPGNDNTCGKRFSGFVDGVKYDHKYTYSTLGYNLRATEIQAAIGLEQLKKLPAFTQTRIHNFNFLYEKLSKLESYFYLPKSILKDTPWFGFPLTLRPGMRFDRDDIITFLNNKGVGTRLLFAGNITRQPAYKDVSHTHDRLTNTDYIMANTFWIGCWQGLTIEQLEYSVAMINEFLNRVE